MTDPHLSTGEQFRRLSIWVAVDTAEVSVVVGESDWHRILSGHELMLTGDGYVYDGDAFEDAWRFNSRGPLTLEIGYDDGGVAFDGPLSEAIVERYNPAKDEFDSQPVLCLEFDSSGEMPVDIFDWAGVDFSEPEKDEVSDRLWDQHNLCSLFDSLPSALLEDLDEEGNLPPGASFVHTQLWSKDCLLLRAELRVFLQTYLMQL